MLKLKKTMFCDKFHLQVCPTNRFEINCNADERFHDKLV